jgi:hypothetical protein
MSVLRVELVAEDFELLHRILTDVDRRTAPLRIVDIAAVDEGCVPASLIGGPTELRDRKPANGARNRCRAGQ